MTFYATPRTSPVYRLCPGDAREPEYKAVLEQTGHTFHFGPGDRRAAMGKITVKVCNHNELHYSLSLPEAKQQELADLAAMASDIIAELPERGTIGSALEAFRTAGETLKQEAAANA